jgi:hypothetical protein
MLKYHIHIGKDINSTLLLDCSRDCPIFYRRKKAQKDLTEAEVQLERWDF